MSTLSPSHANARVHPRRGRLLLLVGLIILLALTAAAAALHAINGRDDTTSFAATGVHEFVIRIHAGRIELTPSLDSTLQVTTTRR